MPRYDPPERSSRPTRQVDPVFLWPVPEEADRLFWVEKDMRLPKDRAFTYGQAYEDAVKYPNHKLVYVSPQNEDNISRWFYASDRTNEDDYNFQHSSCDLGGRKFDSVERTYLVLRSAYDEGTPVLGSDMPTGPSGKFPSGYILAGREQRRTETELDAIYVIETRSYIKRVAITDYQNEDRFGGVFQRVDTLYYRGETISGTAVEDLFSSPTNAFWDVKADGTVRTGQQLSEDWFLVSSSSYTEADSSAPQNTRWRFGSVSSGGVRYRTITTEQISDKPDYPTTSPVIGSLLVTDNPVIGTDKYYLAEIETSATGRASIDATKVVTRLTYVRIPPTGEQTNNLVKSEGGLTVLRSYLVKKADLAGFPAPAVGTADADESAYTFATRETAPDAPFSLSDLFVTVKDIYSRKGYIYRKSFDYRNGWTLSTQSELATTADDVSGNYTWAFGDRGFEVQTSAVTFTGGIFATSNDARPYGSIIQSTTAGSTPLTGPNTSSRLVYEDGTSRVYENSSRDFVFSGGPAGTEIDARAYVRLTTQKTYSTNGSVTAPTGSSRVVYNDGEGTVVYEVGNTHAAFVDSPGGTEVRSQNWGYLSSTITYNTTGTVSGAESSRVIYNDGELIVFEKRSDDAIPNATSFVASSEYNPFVSETVNRSYGLSAVTGENRASRVVYNDAERAIYQNDEVIYEAGEPVTWGTSVNFPLPPVCQGIGIYAVPYKKGGEWLAANPFMKAGFTGRFPATVRRWFSTTPTSQVVNVPVYRPEPISFVAPNYSVRVGPCLHGLLTFTWNSGTDHPIYEYSIISESFPPTSPPDWQGGTFVYDVDVQPYKNGFMNTVVEIEINLNA